MVDESKCTGGFSPAAYEVETSCHTELSLPSKTKALKREGALMIPITSKTWRKHMSFTAPIHAMSKQLGLRKSPSFMVSLLIYKLFLRNRDIFTEFRTPPLMHDASSMPRKTMPLCTLDATLLSGRAVLRV